MSLKVLFLEPFYGGSHREFARGFREHSRHRVELATLPPRFWKWRMRGAALAFARKVKHPEAYDVLVASSLMSLADLKALWEDRCPPAVAYFHENQLAYPMGPGERPDYQYAFTNLTTALAARRVAFNSRYQRRLFLEALGPLLRRMPDFRPSWTVERVREKSTVLYPGCRFSLGDGDGDDPFPEPEALSGAPSSQGPPLVIWNHRWEHDKDPEAFFQALKEAMRKEIPFRVAVLGERFSRIPAVFEEARETLGDRIVQWGFVESRKKYLHWLRRGTVVVSTALQENFGMAVVEAMGCGCFPLLPRRLAYPEVVPEPFHEPCLYDDPEDLKERLCRALADPPSLLPVRESLSRSMERYAWKSVAGSYDDLLESVRDEHP